MSLAIGQHWPYPFWIAHRGAGHLAPENTMAAFELGARYGYRMFECDVKLSADAQAFLLHDKTLTRTTNHAQALGADSDPLAAAHDWTLLSTLDAGSWLGQAFAGERLPLLEALARWCLQHDRMLNIEIKPTPGHGQITGRVVANQAAALWKDATVPPLLTSFDTQALEAAGQAQPDLPRGLLLSRLPSGWVDTANNLGCVAVVLDHVLYTAEVMAQAKNAGLRCLTYTVNEASEVERLQALGIDGIVTDRVDLFKPDSATAGA